MIRLEDVLKMSWRRFCKTSWRRFQNVLKMPWRRFCKSFENLLKTSWRRLEDVWPRWIQIYWSQDVLKTSSEGVWLRRTDVLETPWRRLLKNIPNDAFKTSLRRLHQGKCLLCVFISMFGIVNIQCLHENDKWVLCVSKRALCF